VHLQDLECPSSPEMSVGARDSYPGRRDRRCTSATTIALTTAATFLAIATPIGASAQTYDSALLIVLDVSGSMKDSVVGGVKRDLAVQGLLRTLASLPENTAVSLRLLGEGGSSDDKCAATTQAVSFAPFDRDRWSSVLSTIRWDGATPLVYSMRAALEELRAAPASHREMLIIGDGEESCGEDPVGVARAEAQGIRIHTISLGEKTSHQLAGIALVTGGTYTRAFDETSFEAATTDSLPTGTPPPLEPGNAADNPPMLEVILDVSNSMWGQIDGLTKMQLARDALRAALAELPANVSVGLRAYGHRVSFEDKEAGCADTQLLIPPAPGAATAVVARADELVPRGQTPIAISLEAAATDLEAHGGSGVLLLISDGVESCGGDPVAVAESLRARGVPVVIHAMGLGVDADAAAALKRLASAGGGQYFDAPTAADLVAGVDTVVRSTTEFILAGEDLGAFPREILRVVGGTSIGEIELLDAGTYSFVDHLFHEQRYFAARGAPGSVVKFSGLICALAIGRMRAGVVTVQGVPSRMMAERVDADGNRLRGRSVIVRGDMGEWVEWEIPVSEDGLARFRVGRLLGNVHRDMVFRIEMP
jgi:Mg-chelatase subunit ChlD